MSTVTAHQTRFGALTWWHRGWLEYALRLETAEGTFEAVEDSWFAALASLDLPLPTPPSVGPAEDVGEHRRAWVRWVEETLT